MRTLFIFVIVYLLVGCATQQQLEFKTWNATTEARAKAGDVKWSDYYKGVFERVKEFPSHPDKGPVMQITSTMISGAESFEAGGLPKAMFEEMQRIYISSIESLDGARDAQRRAAIGQALQGISNSAYASQQYYQQQINNQPQYRPPVTCDTRALGGGLTTVCK